MKNTSPPTGANIMLGAGRALKKEIRYYITRFLNWLIYVVNGRPNYPKDDSGPNGRVVIIKGPIV